MWSRKHLGLTLDGSDLYYVFFFTTGIDVSPLVNVQEASSMEHDINSKHPVGIRVFVTCAFFSLFNLIHRSRWAPIRRCNNIIFRPDYTCSFDQ